jgi:hypothetical protein
LATRVSDRPGLVALGLRLSGGKRTLTPCGRVSGSDASDATVAKVKVAKPIFIALTTLASISALYIFARWRNYSDPQGEANSSCIKVDLPSVPNHSGMVVTVHNTACDFFGGDSALYLYVHRSSVADDRRIVFRYFDIYNVEPPKIEWTDESSVQIAVSRVSQVTKQLSTMEGIKIRYIIGAEDYPRRN